MPIYEYQCDACEHRFERIQKFSDPLVDVCPNCGKHEVRKLLSSPAIQFKGSGFYINDYASKGSAGTDAKSGTKGASEGGPSKEGSSTKEGSSGKESSSGDAAKPAASSDKSGPKSSGE
jgi:putative FmdB family regulatory protein